jgi:sugar lactone lactonase YvrE
MTPHASRPRRLAVLTPLALAFLATGAPAADTPALRWIQATAHVIPKETTNDGEGYFSIVTGQNGRLYIGTARHRAGAFLVEFDPPTRQMRVVVDVHKEIGRDFQGFAAQGKIHTRNNVGASGKIYFATKQSHLGKGDKRTDYPGGYPMVYDPKTGTTRVYPIPVPHQGIISIAPDESRGIAYVSTCADQQPESNHFGILDLKSGKYRDLMDCHAVCPFIVLDHRGRAYHPIAGGDIARYDPVSDKLERLPQTIDGKPLPADSLLAQVGTLPANWDISPDGKTLYAQPMTANELYAYDLTATGATIPGRSLGTLLPGARAIDCRALCVGPAGDVWLALTTPHSDVQSLHHLVRYRPGDKAPVDLGAVAIRNPNYTEFTDKAGKPLPFHGGIVKTPDGVTTTQYVILGVSQAADGQVYVLALHPYTLLQITPPAGR